MFLCGIIIGTQPCHKHSASKRLPLAALLLSKAKINHKNPSLTWKPWSQCYAKAIKHYVVLISRQVFLLTDLVGKSYQQGNRLWGALSIERIPICSYLVYHRRLNSSGSEVCTEPVYLKIVSFFYSHYTVQSVVYFEKLKKKKIASLVFISNLLQDLFEGCWCKTKGCNFDRNVGEMLNVSDALLVQIRRFSSP